MWNLYQTARTFKCRPSSLLAVDEPYAAYCLDSAVAQFGTALDAELQAVEGKNKKELKVKSDRVLRKWLDMPVQYRDPVKAGVVALPGKSEEV